MKEKIIYGVISVLIISIGYLGYQNYKINKRVTITENTIGQIVEFIYNVIKQNK